MKKEVTKPNLYLPQSNPRSNFPVLHRSNTPAFPGSNSPAFSAPFLMFPISFPASSPIVYPPSYDLLDFQSFCVAFIDYLKMIQKNNLRLTPRPIPQTSTLCSFILISFTNMSWNCHGTKAPTLPFSTNESYNTNKISL